LLSRVETTKGFGNCQLEQKENKRRQLTDLSSEKLSTGVFKK
jgi:hypothetical protein